MKENRRLLLAALLTLGALLMGSPISAGSPRILAADRLLESPSLDLAQAQTALKSYETLFSQPGEDRVALLTRMARTSFILGDLAPAKNRREHYEKGKAYAELLLRESPQGVEGPYWLALNLCGLAEVGSRMEGFRLLPRIIRELETALARDETYDQAGPHRVLGRIYFEAPRRPVSVGDVQKSLGHLTAAVRIAPGNSTNQLYLGETLLCLGRRVEGCAALARVFQATRHAIRAQGLEDDRRQARILQGECEAALEPQNSGGK